MAIVVTILQGANARPKKNGGMRCRRFFDRRSC